MPELCSFTSAPTLCPFLLGLFGGRFQPHAQRMHAQVVLRAQQGVDRTVARNLWLASKSLRNHLDEKVCISDMYARVSPLPPPCATIAAWWACLDELR